jgi:hypothetical protein
LPPLHVIACDQPLPIGAGVHIAPSVEHESPSDPHDDEDEDDEDGAFVREHAATTRSAAKSDGRRMR